MYFVIILLGTLIAAAGFVIAAKPALLLGYAEEYADRYWFYVTATAFRLILGIALVTYAARSHFPLTFTVIGWLSIVAALVLLVIGRKRLKRLVLYAIQFARYARPAGVLAALFGAFVVYAVV